MYKKFLFKSKEIEGEKGKIKLDYYIVEGEKFLVEGNMQFTMYGVEAVTIHNNTYECETVYDICCSITRARKLCELLTEKEVTPVTLRDIVSDLVCKGDFLESFPVTSTSAVS